MKTIDDFSYQCGVIDCFNEMIKVDVKQLALSHPLKNTTFSSELEAFIQRICTQYDTKYYLEDSLLVCDLFTTSKSVSVYLFYKDEHVLQAYLKLKQRVQEDEENDKYTPSRRKEIAIAFAQLLSYPEHVYEAMIQKNQRQ